MGRHWTAIEPGVPKASESRGALRLLVIPASDLYYGRIATPFALRAADTGARAYVAGAMDAALPVPVEDCLVHAAPEPGGRACGAFAIARRRYGELSAGAAADAAIPAPLAAWFGALAAASSAGASGWLVHLQADGPRWTLIAGNCRADGAFTAPESVVTVAAGDRDAAARAAKILAAGGGGRRLRSFGGADCAGPTLAAAIPDAADACGGEGIPATNALAERYADARLLSCDIVPAEAEGARVRRMRSRRALLVPLAFALLFAAMAAAAGWMDISARAALRRSNAALGEIADAFAGYSQGLAGRAAVLPALNAFAERTDPFVALFTQDSPADALRTIFSFASARSLRISSIEGNRGVLTAEILDCAPGDADALLAALSRQGRTATAAPAGDGGENGALLVRVPLSETEVDK